MVRARVGPRPRARSRRSSPTPWPGRPDRGPALVDALDDPGEAAYSPAARERFALLSDELRRLRHHAGEPLLDLVRRIIDTTGIDVELASSVSPAARARRDNLDLFVKAVADFQAVDGDVSLTAAAELPQRRGRSRQRDGRPATPTEADTVKLLTVHRSKGLEWDAVFLVGVAARHKFPTSQGRVKWTSGPSPSCRTRCAGTLPTSPSWASTPPRPIQRLLSRRPRPTTARRSCGSPTSPSPAPRHELTVSSYLWSPTRKEACGPVGVPAHAARAARGRAGDRRPDRARCRRGRRCRSRRPPTPSRRGSQEVAWPRSAHTAETARRHEAAALVRAGPRGGARRHGRRARADPGRPGRGRARGTPRSSGW